MAFWFHCPICKSKRLAADSIIGRRVRCADCSNFVDVGVPPKDSHVDDEETLRLVEGMITDDALADSQQYAATGLPHAERNVIDDPLPDDLFGDDIVTAAEPIEIEIVEDGTLDSDSNTFDLTSPTVEIIDLQKSERPKQSSSERRAAQAAASAAAGVQPAGPKQPQSKASRYKPDPGDSDGAQAPPFKRKGARGEVEMDMTPMVDVTFLLLIFFMVTASFTLQKSMNRPTETTEDPSETVIDDPEDNLDMVQVDIDEFNSFFVTLPEEDPIEAPSEQDLRIALKNAKQGGSSGISPTKLLIRAHADSFHEKVVTAMDVGTDLDYQLQVQIVEGDL